MQCRLYPQGHRQVPLRHQPLEDSSSSHGSSLPPHILTCLRHRPQLGRCSSILPASRLMACLRPRWCSCLRPPASTRTRGGLPNASSLLSHWQSQGASVCAGAEMQNCSLCDACISMWNLRAAPVHTVPDKCCAYRAESNAPHCRRTAGPDLYCWLGLVLSPAGRRSSCPARMLSLQSGLARPHGSTL